MTNGVLAPDDVLLETYRIVRQLGEGGTGEVYLAKSTATGREVAIKVLKHAYSQDPNFIKLLERELFQNVKHDAVVTYLDLHRSQDHGGLYFLVMEYIDGPSLSDMMQKGPVDQTTLMEIGRRVADGLKAAHGVKVLHRDISPDNIILRHSDPSQATLIDFGIAKDKRPAAKTVIGDGFAGKYEYAAPEQIDGTAVDGRADIYALGATLLAAARGKSPELPVSLKDIMAMKDLPLDVAEVPQPLAGLIRHMTAPRPEDRIGTAADLLRAFESGGAGPGGLDDTRIAAAPIAAQDLMLDLDEPEPDRERKARPKRSFGWLLWPVLAVLVLGAGGFAWQQGWLAEIMKPSLPVANPYRFTAVDGTPPTVDGNAPSEESRAALLAAVTAMSGLDIPPTAVIDLADGMPSETWDDALLEVMKAAEPLDQWRIDVIGTRLVVRGLADSRTERDQVEAELRKAAALGALTLDTNIRVLISPIPLAQVRAALAPLDRCGGLQPDANEDPIPPGAEIRARGVAPDSGAVREVERALGELAEGRRVDTSGIEILNPFVCRLRAQLVPLEAGSMRFQVTEGQSGRLNTTNDFRATDDPVIDIMVPERAQGYLSVFLANNEGAILHLLPYQERAEHRLDQIGEVDGDQRRVRVAFSRSDPSCTRCALNLNSEPFGVNYVFAILTDLPLFNDIRIREENLEDFAPDLAEAVSAAQSRGALQAVTLRQMRVSR